MLFVHHGTTLVKYFYHQTQEKKAGYTWSGDLENDKPDESIYRYDDKTKVQRKCHNFLCRFGQAAAHGLPKVTQHSIEELLESIFSDRLEDGQLDEYPLTLEEVYKIKRSFVKTTLNMLHSRVEYPSEEKSNGKRKDTFSPFNEYSKYSAEGKQPYPYQSESLPFLFRRRLEAFFQSIFSLYPQGPTGDLSVVFMERSSHNKLHGEFLNDYRPTDVITFPPDPAEQMAGEICVSVEQAWDESLSRDLPFPRELSLYLIHGWLHLVGFDDIEKVERKQMRFEEERCLKHIEEQDCWPDFVLAQTDN